MINKIKFSDYLKLKTASIMRVLGMLPSSPAAKHKSPNLSQEKQRLGEENTLHRKNKLKTIFFFWREVSPFDIIFWLFGGGATLSLVLALISIHAGWAIPQWVIILIATVCFLPIFLVFFIGVIFWSFIGLLWLLKKGVVKVLKWVGVEE